MLKKTILVGAMLTAFNASAMLKILVGFPPGGGNYSVARVISDAASKAGVNNVMEIKAGAGGIIGMNDCVNSTEKELLCIASQAQYVHSAVLPASVRKYDPEKLTYVKMIGHSPTVLITRTANTTSMSDLLRDLKTKKAKPDTFAIGALGLKVLTNWFLVLTSATNGVMADYKGAGPAIVDVMAGHVDYAFVPYTTVKSQVDSGLIRVVATVGKSFDKFESIQKYVPAMEADTTVWGFVLGPDADPDQVQQYDSMLSSILQDTSVQEQFEMQGIFVSDYRSSPKDFRMFAEQERQRLSKQLTAMPK